MNFGPTGRVFALCVVGAVFSAAVSATEIVMVAPESPGGTPEIFGGRPAIPSEWKASFLYLYSGHICSATAIGARTVLTAAHCIDSAARGIVKATTVSVDIIRCQRHPLWSSEDDVTHDIALCLHFVRRQCQR